MGGQAISKLDDVEIIEALYKERAKGVERWRSSAETKAAVLKRYDEEKAQAIQMLQKERAKEPETLRQE